MPPLSYRIAMAQSDGLWLLLVPAPFHLRDPLALAGCLLQERLPDAKELAGLLGARVARPEARDR
ncbi:MAG: hypothetical protein AB1758_25510, partial [Candidatus Eremiobacterota bacterium]